MKDLLKTKALDLWQELNEADITYEEFIEVSEYIIDLFITVK